jgi:hypothetical protein
MHNKNLENISCCDEFRLIKTLNSEDIEFILLAEKGKNLENFHGNKLKSLEIFTGK